MPNNSVNFNPLNVDDSDFDLEDQRVVPKPETNPIYKNVLIGVVFFSLVCALFVAVLAFENKSLDSAGNSETESNKKHKPSFEQYMAKANNGSVATDVYECSKIGADILFEGGNAINAAIAATLCLGVLSPASSGIGGGCMILYYDADNDTATFIDSREVAPSQATEYMFANNTNIKASQDGGLAIAVLAELKGLYYAYERYGDHTIPWSRLVTPAAELAKSWIINQNVANSIKYIESLLLSGDYPELSSLYCKEVNGHLVIKTRGDTVHQPILSQTLYHIAHDGIEYIYHNMSIMLAQEIQAAGGIVSAQDIQNYVPKEHAPIQTEVFGYTYYGASGSSSGGATVGGILHYMSTIPTPLYTLPIEQYIHFLIESFSHAFAVSIECDYYDLLSWYIAM